MVQPQILASVESPAPNHILEAQCAGWILVVSLVDTLVDVCNLGAPLPHFSLKFCKFLLRQKLSKRIWLRVDALVKVKFPMLVFILNLPLHDALILHRSGQNQLVLEVFNALNI